jgi:hypothetical protein
LYHIFAVLSTESGKVEEFLKFLSAGRRVATEYWKEKEYNTEKSTPPATICRLKGGIP